MIRIRPLKPQAAAPVILFACIVPAFWCTAPGRAWADGPGRVAFPVEGGLVLATSHWDVELPGDAWPLHAGVLVGAGVATPVSRALALQVGLNYEARGLVLKYWLPGRTDDGEELDAVWVRGTRRMNYICLPVTVVASLRGEAVAPYLRVGTETGFFVSGKSRIEIKTPTERDAEDESIRRKDVHPTDFSLLFGVGVQATRGTPVFAEVRYLHGLRDEFKGLTEWRQRVILMALGVRL